MLTPWKESYDQPRYHIKRQRHYFANKGPSSQGYGSSSSHVWMWELARIHRRIIKKDLHDPDKHNGMITHLEPYILEFKVKWALGSITTNKASGGDGIPVELFQILKDDAVKVLYSICQQIWKTQQWPQDWKMSVFIPIPKKGNAKECSNHSSIVLRKKRHTRGSSDVFYFWIQVNR